uniref:Protein FAM32A n=1 Tax=Parastrongyloides trichosuri TaxID=131310 RepID=A0A0N4ZN88_PARTI
MKPGEIVKGGLKLKGNAVIGKKKEKKKSPEATNEVKKIETTIKKSEKKIKKTAAQIAFEKRQQELAEKRLREQASVSYKDRVNKLNEKLENLSEFNDIPKVSWTK